MHSHNVDARRPQLRSHAIKPAARAKSAASAVFPGRLLSGTVSGRFPDVVDLFQFCEALTHSIYRQGQLLLSPGKPSQEA